MPENIINLILMIMPLIVILAAIAMVFGSEYLRKKKANRAGYG